jgi:hypothetical protein
LGLRQHLFRETVAVIAPDHDPDDAGVDDHLRADDAGVVRAVEDRPFYADPVQRRLNDRVLFGVESPAELVALAGGDMVLFAEAPDFQAMAESRGGAVIACGEDPPVANQRGADTSPDTVARFATSPTMSRK